MIGGSYVVKTYPSIDPIAAPPILITILSVTFNNHERNVSYASLVYGRGSDCPGPPVNTCMISVLRKLVHEAHVIKDRIENCFIIVWTDNLYYNINDSRKLPWWRQFMFMQ